MAEVTGFRNNALPYPVYGLSWAVVFPMLDADGDLVTGATTPDAEVSLNGNTFADCTNESTEIATASGVYYLLLTAAEMTADIVTVIAKSATSGMKTTVLTFYPRKLVSLRTGTVAANAADGTTLQLDSSAVAIDDYYNGCLLVGVIDAVTEARIISDYVGSTKVCTVSPAYNTAPDNNDTFTVYLPEGRQITQSDMYGILGTATSAPATAGILDVNAKNWNNLTTVALPLVPATAGRSLVVDAAGLADANAVKVGPTGAGTAQTARDIGASVLLSTGTGTGQLDFTSGVVKANLAQILGTAITETAGQIAAAFKQFFDVASPTGTMKAITNVVTTTTVTNLTNAPTGGDLTATMKTSVTTAATAATPSVTVSDKTGFSLSAAGLQAIWDALTSALTTVGSIGKLLVDNINATISSRLASASYTAPLDAAGTLTAVGLASANLDTQLDALPTNTELATALGTADDAVLAAIAALNNLSQANVRTAVGLGSANLDTQLAAIVALWTTAMTESYNADGVAPTPAQALFVIMQALTEFSISGTTLTAKKLDGSTTAFTLTLNSATTPSSATRAT